MTPHPVTERHSLSLSLSVVLGRGSDNSFHATLLRVGVLLLSPSQRRKANLGGRGSYHSQVFLYIVLYNTTSSSRTHLIINLQNFSSLLSPNVEEHTSTLCPLKSPVGLRQYKTGLASRVGAPSRERAKFCVVCKSGLRIKPSFFAARRRDCLGSRGNEFFFFFLDQKLAKVKRARVYLCVGLSVNRDAEGIVAACWIACSTLKL